MVRDLLLEREQRRTISKLGLDLMITPDGNIKVVEINGVNSGSSGVRELTGRDIDLEMITDLAQNGIPLFHLGKLKDQVFPHFVSELSNQQLLARKWMHPRASQRTARFVLPIVPGSSDIFEGIIWNSESDYWVFNERKCLLINPFAVEYAARDKSRVHALFQGDLLAPLRPKMAFVVRENKECDVSDFKPNTAYLVLKPTDEMIGRNVIVVPTENIFCPDGSLKEHPLAVYRRREEGWYQEPNVIVEELIYSKKIGSSRTGKEHNGCMRYLILVESDKGEITIKHYGGYWRLAPGSIQDSNPQRQFVANYSNGAIPENISDDDLAQVRKCVDTFVPVLYRRMLRLPINERPDDLPIEAYCY